MVRRLVVAAFVLAAIPARAQSPGQNITDVRVEIAGVPATDVNVLEVVETRVGEPLAMRDVRATIDHLTGLGRFEDVRVLAVTTEQGVALQWQLVPVRRIAKITVTGNPVLSASEIRADLRERFGSAPSTARSNDMRARVADFYRARGFENPSLLPRLQEDESSPEEAEWVLTVDAGSRVMVGAAAVTGAPLESDADVLRALGVTPGRPFDQVTLDARIADYEAGLQQRGYYQARVRESHVPAANGTMNVTLSVEPGPHVTLLFAGDPLPPGNRESLVPVRAERAIDQDLLEDASLRIETALRDQGYRNAQAPYTRDQSSGELVVTFTIARGPLHRIESVSTSGNARISGIDLAPLLQLKSGDPFVQARVGLVAAAITELYRVRGFTQVAVKPDIQVLPEEQAATGPFRPVAVRYEIEEGPQTIVSAVAFEGNDAVPTPALQPIVGLQGGKPFYRPQLSVDRDSLERAYRNQGFQNVSVISQLAFAPDQQQVTLTWTIREGEQITVDRVLINGNDRISTNLIRRELTIEPGMPISDEAMIESQQRLASLGLFRRVRITELPRTGSLSRDVLVDLEEAATTTVDYGGGLEVSGIGGRGDDGSGAVDKIDIGPRGFFSISRRNLWGKNRSITLFGRVTVRQRELSPEETGAEVDRAYGFNDYRGLFTFREPRAFGTSGDGQFTAFIEQSLRTSFTFNRRGVATDYARRLGPFTLIGRHTFDYTKVFDEKISAEDQLLIDRLFPQVKLSKFFGGLTRDSRDDVLDPQKGAVIGVDTSVAAKAWGSEVGFIKSFVQGFFYRRLPGRGIVVAGGARLGVAVGFAEAVPPPLEISRRGGDTAVGAVAATEPFPTVIRELPASERFFAGGDTTVRGFTLDRLGTAETLDPQGFPQGGNGMVILNLETRAPYWKSMQMVWFLDAGNVYKRASDIRLDEMRVTSGVGVRYRSPIGPLRVDWGWKLSTRLLLTGGRERSNVLHISLGQAF